MRRFSMNSAGMKTLLFGVTVACSSVAVARSGEVYIIQCTGNEIRTVETSPQISFNLGKGWGTVRTDPSGGLFDMMTSHCLGAARVVDGKPSLWGHCEWTDRDGDKVLMHYLRSDPVVGKYTVVAGTGKYSGITGTRDYKVTPFPAVPGGRAVCDEGRLRYTLPD
jgi:hypothetical protein